MDSRAPDCLPRKSTSPTGRSSKVTVENPRADNRTQLSFLEYQPPPRSLPSRIQSKFGPLQGIPGFPHASPHPEAVLTVALYWGIFPSLKTRYGSAKLWSVSRLENQTVNLHRKRTMLTSVPGTLLAERINKQPTF